MKSHKRSAGDAAIKLRGPLQLWLRAQGLTFREFARRAGIAEGTIHKWAYRGSRPRALYRAAVARAFPRCPILRAPPPSRS